MQLTTYLLPSLALDIGSQMVRLFKEGSQESIEIPAYLAVDTDTQQVLAVGHEARDMMGRVTSKVAVHKPFGFSGIQDSDTARAYMKVVFNQAGLGFFSSPRFILSVPAHATPAECSTLVQLISSMGARDIITVSAPLAAAIGAGVPIADSSGTCIIHIGASSIEVALVSLGSVVKSVSTDQGLEVVIRLLRQRLRVVGDIEISESMAIELLRSISLMHSDSHEYKVSGHHTTTRAPLVIQVAFADIKMTLQTWFHHWMKLVHNLLYQIPAELSVDTLQKGALVSGGGAVMLGLSQAIAQQLQIPVASVQDNEKVVLKGLTTVMQHTEEFKRSLGYLQ